MLRGAIRGLLRACPPLLAAKVRELLQRDDDYAAPGKPACDWTDRAAREALVDALVRDAYRAHYALRGERLDPRVAEAAALLATVTGQDIEETADGRFAIFEGTAPDRVISTVDPEARHGHKTTAHGFDGYKAHVAIDPDAEVICAAEVSPATSGDAAVAPTLLGDLAQGEGGQAAQAVVYGDSAYGTGVHLAWLEQQGLTPMIKTQLPTAPGGRFAKDQFRIDLQAQTVTCPARVTVAIRPARHGGGRARFGVACSVCPVRVNCLVGLILTLIMLAAMERILRDRGQGAPEGRAAPAHAREHEPGHHAGHQRPADSDHQLAVRGTARSAAGVHQEPAALRPACGISRHRRRPTVRRDRTVDEPAEAGAAVGAIRGLRTHDAEWQRDRGSQRPTAGRQLRADLHRHHQAVRGGGPRGAARVRGSADRPSEPARVPLDARRSVPAAPASMGGRRPRRLSPSCSSISTASRSSTTRSDTGSATCCCRRWRSA